MVALNYLKGDSFSLKKITMKSVLIAMLLAFLLGCAERERLNPIDPQNPKTGGRPQRLQIYSDLNVIVLQWDRLDLTGIQGYRVYRSSARDSAFRAFSLVPSDSNRFIDRGVNYGHEYRYFLTVLAGDFETPSSDTIGIVPGPTNIWVTDVYNRRLIKVSHDGSHEIRQIGVDGHPWAIAYDGEQRTIWYSDVLQNRIYRVNPIVSEVVLDLGNGDPIDLAYDQRNNRIWIADQNLGRVYALNRQGQKIGEKSDFKKPVSLDFVSSEGSCWVVDAKTKTLHKISANLISLGQISNFINPSSVSVNQSSGDCWIADSSRIVRIDLKGRIRLSIERTGSFLRYLAVDSVLNCCWVIDFSFFANKSRLLCFNNSGDQLLELEGLNWPTNLKVNPYDHCCVIAEAGNGRLLKISPQGQLIGEVKGYYYPRGLFIEF